jgi:phosphopantothenoylcysteine decarboxylase/phosphopantothenate--cysteine ligase
MTQPQAQAPLIGLGVSGGIGAYKSVELARLLQKRGYAVQAIMTRNATRFIGPLTFEAITQRPVITGQFASGMNADIEHIALATDMRALVVAPATANVIGKFAHGLADDFLSALHLATRAPIVLAPAMNTVMWEHPAVRDNLAMLVARGATIVEPGEGYLACGWVGKGRLAEPAEIAEIVDRVVTDRTGKPASSLAGLRVLVTAGPTREDLDPVRYLGNRSSGRMGFAVARQAMRRGANVQLIAGPTSVPPPAVTILTRVRSAAEMYSAVMDAAAQADIVVMAAAVADYTPAEGAQADKIQKAGAVALQLVRTADILAALGEARGDRARPILVGFAAETGDPVVRATQKRRAKRVDLIVANDVSADDSGFDVETNRITLVDAAGSEPFPLMSKDAAAAAILDRAERLIAPVGGD